MARNHSAICTSPGNQCACAPGFLQISDYCVMITTVAEPTTTESITTPVIMTTTSIVTHADVVYETSATTEDILTTSTAVSITTETTTRQQQQQQQQLSITSLVSDSPAAVGEDVTFSLILTSRSTIDCILWNFTNGRQDVLLGPVTCVSDPTSLDVRVMPSDDVIAIKHSFVNVGQYDVEVKVWNTASVDSKTVRVSVVMAGECSSPEAEIPSMGDSINNAVHVKLYKPYLLSGRVRLKCKTPRAIKSKWKIHKYINGGFNKVVFSADGKLQRYIPGYTFDLGLYRASFEVFPEGFEPLSTKVEGYLQVKKSRIHVVISGGSTRSVAHGSMLVFDGSESRDSDVQDGGVGTFVFKWSCWKLGDLPTDAWCHSNPPGSQATIYGDSSNWNKSHSYVIRLEVSNGQKSSNSTQRIDFVTTKTRNIATICLSNCEAHFIRDQETKLEAICTNCVEGEDHSSSYRWQLYKLSSTGIYKEVMNLGIWTTTGSKGRYLAVKKDIFLYDESYRIMVHNNGGYALYDFTVRTPPHGGSCDVNTYIGYAWETEFIFTCNDYKDGNHNDATTMFLYDFRYRQVGSGTITTPLIVYRGRHAVTQPLLLPSGFKEFDHDVEIHVRIINYIGASTDAILIIKVTESKLSPSDPMTGIKMREFEMKQDYPSMVNYARGVDTLISQQEEIYYNQENYEERLDEYEDFLSSRGYLLAVISRNTDLLVDSGDCLLTAQTMKSFTSRPDTLSDNAKSDIGDILYATITTLLRVDPAGNTADNRILATEFLSSITAIQNTSRIAPRCPDPDPITVDVSPEDKAILEERAEAEATKLCTEAREKAKAVAMNLNRSLLLIKKLVLQRTVPGEAVFVFETSEVIYKMRMMESTDLNDVTFDIGDGSFYLPNKFGRTLAIQKSRNKLDLSSNGPLTVAVGVETTFSEENEYAFSDSAPMNQSGVGGISLVDESGDDVVVDGLQVPVEFHQKLSGIKTETKEAQIGSLMFTKFNMTSGPLFIEISPNIEGFTCTVYLGFNEQPNETVYDWTKQLDFSAHDSLKNMVISPDDGTTYLGYVWQASNNDTDIVSFKLTIWQPKCVYYGSNSGTWQTNGCTVSGDSTSSEIVCLTSHLTLFSSDWIVPPNTIDFNTVFDDGADKLLENIHVFVTMTVILVLYLILVIVLRRLDKKDVRKWGVAPLADNTTDDVYHYQLTVHTGMRKNAGTQSTAYFMLGGETTDTEVRKLEDTLKRPLARGSVNNYLLSVPDPLGALMYIRVWHDNCGKGAHASWFIDRIVIRDIQTNEVYVFLADRWLAVDRADGNLECFIPAASEKDLANFQFLFSSTTRDDMSDGHLWFSLVSRPTRSRFTRVQRLSACLALLFATMIANAMWYRSDEDIEGKQVVRLGPLTFTPQQLFISLASSVVSIPISIIIVTLFRKAGPKPSKGKKKQFHLTTRATQKACKGPSTVSDKVSSSSQSSSGYLGEELDDIIDYESTDERAENPQIHTNEYPPELAGHPKKRKKPFMLPWWCSYVAWFLVFVTVSVSGTFTMLYSFEWGGQKSSEWLTAFVLSFFESVIFVQPLKVIGIAVVIALVIKRPKTEVTPEGIDGMDGDFISSDVKDTDMSHRMKRTAHRKPYMQKEVNESRLEKMRAERADEKKMWAIFREILSYMLYIMVISVLTYDNKDPNAYRSKEELTNTFVKGTFTKVRNFSDFWRWSNKTLVPNLYADVWYNNEDTHWRNRYLTRDLAYFRIGSPRLRLAKVKPNSCDVTKRMAILISSCYDSYGMKDYDDANYGEGWQSQDDTNITLPAHVTGSTPWHYQSTLALDGVPIWGNVDAYSGGGYVAELGTKPHQALQMMKYLKENRWLERSARAVFIEFNLFNPNTNLFSIVNLILEFPASGGTVHYPIVQTIRLYNYLGGRAVFRLFLDIAFVIFMLYFFVVEVKSMRKQKRAYMKSFWNILEVLNLFGSMLACALYGVHYIFARLTMRKFRQNQEKFTNFQYILNWDDIFGYVLGLLVFIAMIKLLKMLRFNKKVTELMTTLDVATKPLLGFFLFFAIVYVAFAQFSFMVFGRSLLEYSTFISTLESLFSMMLMNFNYANLEGSDKVLGPVFFFVYVLVLAFVIINVLVSILNESFNQVKRQRLLSNDDYKMVDYIVRNFKKLFAVNDWAPSMSFKKSKTGYIEYKDDPPGDLDTDEISPVSLLSQNPKHDSDVYDSLRQIPSVIGHYGNKQHRTKMHMTKL